MPQFSYLKQLAIPAPVAARKEHLSEYHGVTLSDPYFWLKDQNYPEVGNTQILDYLNAENTYHSQFLEPHTTLVDTVSVSYTHLTLPTTPYV